jgi:type VI protein secretion system component Hcp
VAYEIWVKIDGVEAGLTEGVRRGWSPVLSASQSVQNVRGAGEQFQFMNVMRQADRSTPILAKLAAEARHLREATIEFVSKDAVLRVRLQDVTIQNFSLSGGPQAMESMPMENLALEARKVEWALVPESGREVKASWPPEGAARPAAPVEV